MSEQELRSRVRRAAERDRLPNMLRRLRLATAARAVERSRHVDRMTIGRLGVHRRD